MSSHLLPPLRRGLDLMPSPVPDRPGLLIRDPLGYSDATLIIPPALVPCLTCLDGEHSELDLRELLVRLTGELQVGPIADHLLETLHSAGLLEDERGAGLRAEREQAFREAAQREAAHAGSAYPETEQALREQLASYLQASAAVSEPDERRLLGVAAPHVSLEGGHRCYAEAYGALVGQPADTTFIVLGTSHYGEPDRFGLTRKPFTTPLGTAQVDAELAESLAESSGPAADMEDYCHSVEHSIELQVVFLQHLFGPQLRFLPILCGPFSSCQLGGRPEENPGVDAFIESLAVLAREEGRRFCWVLGIDLAHMGRRYGDSWSARADAGQMQSVARDDHDRLERVVDGDAAGLWQRVQQDGDPLKWCGSSPLYCFLRAARPRRGRLLRYEQWNIDADSVVSFAALAFHG